MSILIAVCTEKYGIMMADTRMVKESNVIERYEILSDEFLKMKPINDNVCIGFTGDGYITWQIMKQLPTNGIGYTDEYISVLEEKCKEIILSKHPVHFIIFGRNTKGELTINTVSSYNGFKPTIIMPRNSKPECRVSLPPSNELMQLQYMRQLNEIVYTHNGVEDLRIKLELYVKGIAISNPTINGNVVWFQIVK